MIKSGITLAALLCLFSVAKAIPDGFVFKVIFGYVFSIFCFPFAILLVMRSEAKLIRYDRFTKHLAKTVKTIDPNMPKIEDNFKVCHMHGNVTHPLMIINDDFGIIAENAYRIKRTVEMYQWVQKVHQHQERYRRYNTYHYHKAWVPQMLDSSKYAKKEGHENPNIQFPFCSEQQEADEVNLGLTFLKKDSIVKLGGTEEVIRFTSEKIPQLDTANAKMMEAGYGLLTPEDEYLVSKPQGWENSTDDIGKYRIRYTIHRCGEATVIGQQVQDDRGLMTLRRYNPKNTMAPYPQDTSAEPKQVWCGIENQCACCCCICAEKCANLELNESIHLCKDGNMTIEEFKKMKGLDVLCSIFIRRVGGYILNALCLSLLMLPFVENMCYNFVYRNIEVRDAETLNSFIWSFIVAIPWTIFLSGIGIACEAKALGGVVATFGFVLMVVLFAIPSPDSC